MLALIDRKFNVPVSVDKAWEHLAKVEEWTSWAKHIKRLELETGTPLDANSKGKIYLQNGITSSFEMTEFNPTENWMWAGPFLWMTVYYDHRFRPIDDQQTEITFHVAGEGIAVGVAGRLFASVYNRNLDKAIPNLVREYEAMA